MLRCIQLAVVVAMAGSACGTTPRASRADPAGPIALDVALKRKTLEDFAVLVEESYVFPAVAVKLSARLREMAADETSWRDDDARAFADHVNKELRAIVVDGHLGLYVKSQAVRPADAPVAEAEIREQVRRRNFDFVELRFLRGTIGYVELRSFPPYDWIAESLQGAFQFLANADAVIIDLRRNGGGAADSVGRVAGYFFAAPTHISTTIHRRRGESKNLTTPPATASRLASVDVYILCSKETVSAAEAFAYALQGHHRAIVVGETTAGAANAGDTYSINEVFDGFVPDLAGTHPATGRNWEGTGVVPDIAVDADQALDVAHAEALRRLASGTSDPQRRREYQWSRDAVLRRSAAPPRSLDKLAGHYGPIRIRLDDGALYFQRETEPIDRLDAISDRTFMLSGTDELQLVFESDPPALLVRRSNGSETRHPRAR